MNALQFFLSAAIILGLAIGCGAATITTGYVQTFPSGVQAAAPSVSSMTVGQLTDTGLTAGGCVQASNAGLLSVTGINCGTGSGSGSSSGTINTASQYSAAYYSFTGSSNVISGLAPGTSGQYLLTAGSSAAPFWATPPYLNGTASILGFTLGGVWNTWLGVSNLSAVTSGDFDSAFGYESLFSDTSGSQNTAAGFRALYSNTTGNSNDAYGYAALFENTTGISNDAFGWQALFQNTGSSNAAFGYDSCVSNTIGNNLLCVGANSNVGSNNLSNASAIGPNATVTTSNTMQLGNNVNVIASTITTTGEFCFQDGSCQATSANASGSTILNQNTLQSGATFYVSSGTVAGNLSAYEFIPINSGGTQSGGYVSIVDGDLGLIGNGAPIYLNPGTNQTVNIVQNSTLAFISSNGYIGLQSSSTLTGSSPVIYTLPSARGVNGQILGTDSLGDIFPTSGSSLFIQNSNSLQSGTTFYVSSGSVQGQFNVISNTAGSNPSTGTWSLNMTNSSFGNSKLNIYDTANTGGFEILYSSSSTATYSLINMLPPETDTLIGGTEYSNVISLNNTVFTAYGAMQGPGFTANTTSTTFSGANGLDVTYGITAGSMTVGNGSASSPSYKFSSESNTGMYWPASGQLAFVEQGFISLNLVESGSSQYANLSLPLWVTPSTTNVYALIISSSNAGSLSSSKPYIIDISTIGHLNAPETAAVIGTTVTSCGTTPSLTGNDTAGTIATSGSVTSCTLTFGKPYTNTPVCTESDSSTGLTADITSISNTAVTFGFSSSLGTGKIWYICIGSD